METRESDVLDSRGLSDRVAELEVLHGICHAYGSATDLTEALASAVLWVRAALGQPDATVRISFPDRSGRLRLAHQEGQPAPDGRRRSAHRRVALESKRPDVMALSQPLGAALAIFPLVSRGECLGALEVIAPRQALQDRWELLSTVVSQVAIVVRNVRGHAESERQVQALSRATELARELVRAQTREEAFHIALRFTRQTLGLPVAAWFGAEPHQPALDLLGARGFEPARREELERTMKTIPEWQSIPDAERRKVLARFAAIAGEPDVAMVDVPSGILMIAGAGGALQVAVDALGALLTDVLIHLGTVWWAKRRNEGLDVGIAVTAHEVRGPVLGAKAAIDVLLENGDLSHGRRLVERSREELGNLASLMEGLLRWSVGSAPPRRRTVDVLRLVEGAVEACCLECGGDRFLVTGPEGALVRADRSQLRIAVLNLLRNAASYSPPATKVVVSVSATGDAVTVSIRDRGKGVPLLERTMIFDPFARGNSGGNGRNGSGLGLFVARRIVEAHDGTIWLESGKAGSTFHLQLPASPSTREQASSSAMAADGPG